MGKWASETSVLWQESRKMVPAEVGRGNWPTLAHVFPQGRTTDLSLGQGKVSRCLAQEELGASEGLF